MAEMVQSGPSAEQSTAGMCVGRLNPAQRRAVGMPFNKVLAILAGAGTGKTTTLLARIEHMIASGIPAGAMPFPSL